MSPAGPGAWHGAWPNIEAGADGREGAPDLHSTVQSSTILQAGHLPEGMWGLLREMTFPSPLEGSETHVLGGQS